MWLAGAGVKRAYHHGATDDFGYNAAIVLKHRKGIERRLTDVHGHVIEPILA